MDLATKLFSLSFGVEPNKATLKDFSDILNSAGKYSSLLISPTCSNICYPLSNSSNPRLTGVRDPASPKKHSPLPVRKAKSSLRLRRNGTNANLRRRCQQQQQPVRAYPAGETTRQAAGEMGHPRGEAEGIAMEAGAAAAV